MLISENLDYLLLGTGILFFFALMIIFSETILKLLLDLLVLQGLKFGTFSFYHHAFRTVAGSLNVGGNAG